MEKERKQELMELLTRFWAADHVGNEASQYEARKALIVALLEGIDPSKPMGTAFFDAMARLTLSVALEAMAIRTRPEDGRLEIYLKKRSDTDTAYPGQWHTPGTVLWSGNKWQEALDRLARKEFGSVDPMNLGEFVWLTNSPDNPEDVGAEVRGHFLSAIWLLHEPPDGFQFIKDETHKWVLLDELSSMELVRVHERILIPKAIEAYKRRRLEEHDIDRAVEAYRQELNFRAGNTVPNPAERWRG